MKAAPRVGFVSLGCPKALVDSEGILTRLRAEGYALTRTHEGADLEAFLDREQERYRKQLEQYAKLMRGLDGRQIRMGLYFPLLKGWREWTTKEI